MDDGRASDERNLDSRRMDYSATLSRLYFCYESFIYSCIREWVTYALSNRLAPENFSYDTFFDEYATGCGQILQRTDEQRFSHITKKQITESLYGVLERKDSAKVIVEALSVDLPNLRLSALQTACQRAQLHGLGEWLGCRDDLDEACSDFIGSPLIDNALKDFVERRNSVSHARFEDDGIYATNILLKLCSLVKKLCHVFAEFVSYNYLGRGVNAAISLGSVSNYFKKADCHLVETSAEMFDVGREVYLCRPNTGRCFPAHITDIQLEGESMFAVTTGAGDIIGIKLSTVAKKGTVVMRPLEIPGASDAKQWFLELQSKRTPKTA
nr:MAE_28990/MAE_18760 family HEPN-like nuclease [Burkholderia ambifaria]